MYELYDLNDIWKTFVLLGIVHSFIYYKRIRIALWPLLHVTGNLYIVYRSFDAVAIFIKNPIGALSYENGTENIPDTRIILLSLHMYHQLMFKLNAEDKWHHYMFVYCGTAFTFFTQMGVFLGIYNLFVCGIPSAIFYTLLVLKSRNLITKSQGCTIHRLVDLWIRSPCLSMVWAFGLIICLQNSLYLHIIPITFLTLYNGQHYADIAIRNYEKMRLEISL